MLKIERQNIIEQEITKQGFVLVPALSDLFRCSEETVRRDLKEMEAEGRLVRTHGGAYLVEKYDKSYPTDLRKSYLHRTKGKMAQLAMQEIQENEVLMLDASTTCLALAEALILSQKPVTIITNSLQVCALCSESVTNINLVCAGGTFRMRTASFADQNTMELLRRYHADRAFISCPKVTLEYGLADNHLNEAKAREWMLRQASHRYLLADHTKFVDSADVLFPGLESLDMIITDRHLSPEWESFAKEHHIRLSYSGE